MVADGQPGATRKMIELLYILQLVIAVLELIIKIPGG